jgi:hypothetical protein
MQELQAAAILLKMKNNSMYTDLIALFNELKTIFNQVLANEYQPYHGYVEKVKHRLNRIREWILTGKTKALNSTDVKKTKQYLDDLKNLLSRRNIELQSKKEPIYRAITIRSY